MSRTQIVNINKCIREECKLPLIIETGLPAECHSNDKDPLWLHLVAWQDSNQVIENLKSTYRMKDKEIQVSTLIFQIDEKIIFQIQQLQVLGIKNKWLSVSKIRP